MQGEGGLRGRGARTYSFSVLGGPLHISDELQCRGWGGALRTNTCGGGGSGIWKLGPYLTSHSWDSPLPTQACTGSAGPLPLELPEASMWD